MQVDNMNVKALSLTFECLHPQGTWKYFQTQKVTSWGSTKQFGPEITGNPNQCDLNVQQICSVFQEMLGQLKQQQTEVVR